MKRRTCGADSRVAREVLSETAGHPAVAALAGRLAADGLVSTARRHASWGWRPPTLAGRAARRALRRRLRAADPTGDRTEAKLMKVALTGLGCLPPGAVLPRLPAPARRGRGGGGGWASKGVGGPAGGCGAGCGGGCGGGV
ncbi:hypothetical protein DEJ50_26620 [Streptomyces venezuelae]|uniref:Uncharacterized protein n=1 Tax=Streptomyces venezuelae TaxID=54571 RepID=A0A5P2D7Z7_STRVZ|nr:hypothetical protein [Streptomyces venezuelae]QES50873.1 hypothetical protein DEJ50_26620 [Streptomyces venezuelae]